MRVGIAALILGLLTIQVGASPEPLTLTRSIELPHVEGRIDYLAFDPATQRLYVAALGNNTVEVLDVQTGTHLRSLRGFREPQGIAVATDASAVGVANGQGEGLQLLGANDYRPGGVVRLGDDADNVRYDAAARRLYVGYGDGALAAIDPASGTLLGQAKLAAHPESFQLEREGSRVFVNVPNGGQIAVVDRTSMSVTITWPLTTARANYPMALDEPNHRLFIGCRRPAKALVLDTTAGQERASFEIVGDADDLFYDAARGRVYVSGGDGFIDVVQDQGGNRFARITSQPPPALARRCSLPIRDVSTSRCRIAAASEPRFACTTCIDGGLACAARDASEEISNASIDRDAHATRIPTGGAADHHATVNRVRVRARRREERHRDRVLQQARG